MTLTREQICQETARKLLAAVPSLPSISATIGLDGFVDEIIAVVDKRSGPDAYDPVPTIAAFGKKISAAAGQSSNYELVTKVTKLGGNGPIMANALACAGLGVTYIGSVGYPQLHPAFADFAKRAKVISVCDAGHTDALEFADGKLMLGKYTVLNDMNWPNLVSRVGGEQLQSLVESAALVGFVNWTMLPHMTDIWDKLDTEVLAKVSSRRRIFFVDLADPEKRHREDIAEAMRLCTRLQEHVDVILGLNLKESGEIAEVIGIPAAANPEAEIEATAKAIRAKLGLHCVVVHPRKGAAAATAEAAATFFGPFVEQPKISTGAGDHFNAGFCLGRVLGFDLAQSLCTGVATSGYYVRTAISPSAMELAGFINELPPPQA